MHDKLRRLQETHRLDKGRPALLVIDMQHGFLDEGASLEVPKGRDVIGNVQRLVVRFRQAAAPVIFTEFVYHPAVPCLRGDPFGIEHLPATGPAGFGSPSSNCMIGPDAGKGVESAETIEELKPLAEELVLQAHTYDKFYGTHLDLALRSHGVDRLAITGVTTDVCVNSTLISAATRNYRVTAVTDAVATIHDHIQEACFQIWQNKFARLKTTDDVLAEVA